jgi:leucyl aminopeptidase
MHPLLTTASAAALPIWFVDSESCDGVLARLGAPARHFAKAAGFEPKPGRFLVLPGLDGKVTGALFGIATAKAQKADTFLPGRLSSLLPPGVWRFGNTPRDPKLAVLAFLLNAYDFSRYRKAYAPKVKLAVPAGVDATEITRIAEAVTLTRDLINTPSNDMGPAELESAARKVAARHKAKFRSIAGKILARDFPLIQAVGGASTRTPRLIDFTWGNPKHPKITLVGKGVCFDTGGLDIKPSSGMLNMKKDMGGAATVLGLAHMIMDAKLKVRLRVLIPAVENSIAGNAFRPRDVYRSRKGITVEIGNTDAEGRLVLADALALADDEKPELIVDMATLTGAARVALGPELPPFYTDDEKLAGDLIKHGAAENDPLWRMPLWQPYAALLDSTVADMNNVSSGGFAGSITAALFLRRFVEQAKAWLHLDIFAWSQSSRPARALYALLKQRYG